MSPDDFEPLVGTIFEVCRATEESLGIRLTEVACFGERPGHRVPFALRFHGPVSPVLEHAIHPVEHPGIGRLELFLGPVQDDGPGITYEAVFA